ncbi:MAG: ATPase P [Clostridiales bacterium]|nr:ATPase P [Clostridiales bacterium]
MLFKPRGLASDSLEEKELEEDKKHCKRFGPCGIGKKAVYLNSFYFDRRYYVPFSCIHRLFKRVAMSKGGFSGKGIFATIPYLVVQYEDGKEKQCIFKHEEHVDDFLQYIKKNHPEIKLHSEEAEKRLLEKETMRLAKKAKSISDVGRKNIEFLKGCCSYLEESTELSTEMSRWAKRKRVYDRSKPAYQWAALFITLLGVGALVYGIYALFTHAGFGLYFLLFGLAAIFLFSSANVLPTAKNNKKYIEKQLQTSINHMDQYISKFPDFPLPAYYAHPVVLKRMIELIEEGRAETIVDALEGLKQDLKAVNSSVTVDQEEYDEIMAIKPMFLVMNYQ